MIRVIKLISISTITAILLLFASFIIFPNKTKFIKQKGVRIVKKSILYLRGSYQTKQFSTYQPGENEIWGIDISHHQKSINWNEMEHNKPKFVFLKSTEGSTHIDTKHKVYKKRLKNLSIPTGSYHFFSYGSSGIKQAKHFLKNANVKKGDLTPVLDVEFKNNMPNKDYVTKNITDFMNYITNEIGVPPLIYCECDYYNKYIKDKINTNTQYWISDFWRTPKCNYLIWQKTDKFKHIAFKGTVDFNTFNGNLNDLNKLILK